MREVLVTFKKKPNRKQKAVLTSRNFQSYYKPRRLLNTYIHGSVFASRIIFNILITVFFTSQFLKHLVFNLIVIKDGFSFLRIMCATQFRNCVALAFAMHLPHGLVQQYSVDYETGRNINQMKYTSGLGRNISKYSIVGGNGRIAQIYFLLEILS